MQIKRNPGTPRNFLSPFLRRSQLLPMFVNHRAHLPCRLQPIEFEFLCHLNTPPHNLDEGLKPRPYLFQGDYLMFHFNHDFRDKMGDMTGIEEMFKQCYRNRKVDN